MHSFRVGITRHIKKFAQWYFDKIVSTIIPKVDQRSRFERFTNGMFFETSDSDDETLLFLLPILSLLWVVSVLGAHGSLAMTWYFVIVTLKRIKFREINRAFTNKYRDLKRIL